MNVHTPEPEIKTETSSETEAKPLVLVLEDDLFFSVRIETMLKKAGYAPHVVTQPDELVALCEARRPALLIVNFGSERLNAAETVRKVKELPGPPPVLGYVPHKWMPQVRPNAVAAGCDLLVANSALVLRLPTFAARLAPLPAAAPD